jgi:hypothetical protein
VNHSCGLFPISNIDADATPSDIQFWVVVCMPYALGHYPIVRRPVSRLSLMRSYCVVLAGNLFELLCIQLYICLLALLRGVRR